MYIHFHWFYLLERVFDSVGKLSFLFLPLSVSLSLSGFLFYILGILPISLEENKLSLEIHNIIIVVDSLNAERVNSWTYDYMFVEESKVNAGRMIYEV